MGDEACSAIQIDAGNKCQEFVPGVTSLDLICGDTPCNASLQELHIACKDPEKGIFGSYRAMCHPCRAAWYSIQTSCSSLDQDYPDPHQICNSSPCHSALTDTLRACQTWNTQPGTAEADMIRHAQIALTICDTQATCARSFMIARRAMETNCGGDHVLTSENACKLDCKSYLCDAVFDCPNGSTISVQPFLKMNAEEVARDVGTFRDAVQHGCSCGTRTTSAEISTVTTSTPRMEGVELDNTCRSFHPGVFWASAMLVVLRAARMHSC